ncbi:MAG: hypothetical protein KY475_08030 [Planctomycetes bacterium]|nr:hypothetical protein [Planctomycetota bacterium]
MRNFFSHAVTICVAVVLAVAASGWLVGWLVGSSQSPVVGTVIPLVFGLIAVFTYPALAKHFRNEKLSQLELDDLGLDANQRVRLRSRLDVETRPPWLLTVSAAAVVVFCLACAIGVWQGIGWRVPTYPPLDEMVRAAEVPVDNLSPHEAALLHNLRWRLRGAGVPVEDTQAAFAGVVRQIFAQNPTDEFGSRVYALHNAIDSLTAELEGRVATYAPVKTVTFPTPPPAPTPRPLDPGDSVPPEAPGATYPAPESDGDGEPRPPQPPAG